MRYSPGRAFFVVILFAIAACVSTGGEVVKVTTVSDESLSGIGEAELARIAEIKEVRKQEINKDSGLKRVIQLTPNYTVSEYLSLNPDAGNLSEQDYRVGGYDVFDVMVYEEKDLSREKVRVSAEGDISFPLIGRVRVDGLTTSEIESLIAQKLTEGQFILDAHVSVTVVDYLSKQYMVLGSVKEPGTYPLQSRERVLDAISRSGGIDFEQGGKQGMIIRTENPNTDNARKVVIRIDIPELLKGGDQMANMLLADKDLLFVPKAEHFYIIGQVQKPGSYLYQEKEITIVEAISMAGGFTQIAARNKTRIVRVENGEEKIIEIRVDEITRLGKKGQDILIEPGDVIVVPESFF
ncbi:MAG: polysaccharide export protein [Desulfobacterales bacterium]|nr:polysaccharide export protein [Desulfobacterales bacterium]MDD4073106.1 polysaccharide export protein [Desulfobacterales bacterium]MDD4394081.1 polysaccharide export protein [Desulfobacterales bacterium]